MKTIMNFGDQPFNGDTFLQQEFLNLRDDYSIKTVIETGTHLGITAQWLCENFAKVLTVEINRDYLRAAIPLLEKYTNCTVIEGDSRTELLQMLFKADGNMIVFLDAHWRANPVIDELNQIRLSGKKPIIAIHDFKNPHHPDYGFDAYPDQGITYEWEWVRPHIEAIYGVDGFEHYFNNQATGAKRGCVFILPKS